VSDCRWHHLASSGHSKAEPLAPLRNATDTGILRGDGRCFGKFLAFIFLVARLNRVLAHWWGSRLRLFGDEAGDIGSDAIAVALLQQHDRVNRAAEKSSCASSEG
jgi:hypothetical protein